MIIWIMMINDDEYDNMMNMMNMMNMIDDDWYILIDDMNNRW